MKKRLKMYYRKVLPPLVATLGKWLLKLVVMTCRVKIEGLDTFLKSAATNPTILMLWHNRLAIIAPALWHHGRHLKFAALISASRDGELLAAFVENYKGCRAIRVSHSARHHALREVISQLKSGDEVLLVTPDGPRGPRYKVKPGIALAAKASNAHVIPVTWSANRFWQLRTWDKLIFPKPFSRILLTFGDAIKLEDEQGELALENALHSLTLSTCAKVTANRARWPQ